MKKNLLMILSALLISVTAFAIPPITGTINVCVGANTTLADATPGGVWTTSDPLIATVGASTGIVSGVAAGVVGITYTVGTSSVSVDSFVVSAAPAPIAGATTLCTGATTILTESTPGGTWMSSDPAIVMPYFGGEMSGVSAGTAIITYYMGGGCMVTTTLTVDFLSAGVITGDTFVCTGSTATVADAVPGGVWSSSNPAVATVSGSGFVTGLSVGYTNISYTVTGACGSTSVVQMFNDFSTTFTGTISGPNSVELGGYTSVWSTGYGGTWTSSDPSIASITPSGTVTGVSWGTVTLTYTVTGCTGTLYTTAPFSVYTSIYGTINVPTPYTGSIKVWLITYNPATLDLEARDSADVVVTGGTSVAYFFKNVAPVSIRIKAALDTSYTGAGIIPTYHTSNFYWYDATVLNHTGTANDYGQDINMASGTMTTGPGFISGNVTAGANKGTTVTGPAKNVHICVVNSATNQIIQQTYTDASGNYSFTNLPVGQTYYVFPDSLHFITTAYTGISLTTAHPSMTVAKFALHTLSKTITPITTGITNVSNTGSSLIAFPNPTKGKLNIQWNDVADEKGTVVVTNMLGQEVYTTSLTLNQGSGTSLLDLSGLANGVYLISVKSETISYQNKIELQH